MWPNQGPPVQPSNPAFPSSENPAYTAMPISQCPPEQNPVYPPGITYPPTILYMTPNQHPFLPAVPGPHAQFPETGLPCPSPQYGGHQAGMTVPDHKKHKKEKKMKKGKKAHKVHKKHTKHCKNSSSSSSSSSSSDSD